jgi:hypothetical protein
VVGSVRTSKKPTMRFDSSMSILLPRTTNGKFSGSCGEAFTSTQDPTKGLRTHLNQELVPPSIERFEALA